MRAEKRDGGFTAAELRFAKDGKTKSLTPWDASLGFCFL